MVQANLNAVSDWKSVTAAVLYLATFLALCYGSYVYLTDGAFLSGFLFAFPRALVFGLLGFTVATAVEACWSRLRGAAGKPARETKRLIIHS